MEPETSIDHLFGTEPAQQREPTYELSDFLFTVIGVAANAIIEYDDEDEEEADQAHEQAWDLKLTKRTILHLCADALDELGWFDCLWCSVNTSTIHEYYMVHNEIWQLYGPKRDGHLCIGCLEDRMGRTLTPEDFTDALINTEGTKSERLRDRLGISA